MKNIRWILVCILLSALLINTGCSKQAEYPPHYEKISQVLGQDLETVVAHMGLSLDDFEYRNGFYCLKDPIAYFGYNFEMRLVMYRNEHANHVMGVSYLLQYDNDPQGAAGAVIDLRDKLKENHGSPNSSQSEFAKDKATLESQTKENLVTTFSSGKNSVAGINWTLSKKLDSVPKEILEAYDPSCVYLQFTTGYPVEGSVTDGNLGSVVITLEYYLMSR